MKLGEIYLLADEPTQPVVLMDKPTESGTVLVAPIWVGPHPYQSDRDLQISGGALDALTGLAYIELWHLRSIPTGMLGRKIATLPERIKVWVSEIQTADVLGEKPDVPRYCLGRPIVGEEDPICYFQLQEMKSWDRRERHYEAYSRTYYVLGGVSLEEKIVKSSAWRDLLSGWLGSFEKQRTIISFVTDFQAVMSKDLGVLVTLRGDQTEELPLWEPLGRRATIDAESKTSSREVIG